VGENGLEGHSTVWERTAWKAILRCGRERPGRPFYAVGENGLEGHSTVCVGRGGVVRAGCVREVI
jgi:hypothetical protein